MRYFFILLIISSSFFSLSQKQEKSRIYTSIYETNKPVFFQIYTVNPHDTIFVDIQDTNSIRKKNLTQYRTLRHFDLQPKHFFKAYSDSFRSTQNLYFFLQKRRYFTFLFKTKGKLPNNERRAHLFDKSKDSMYFNLLIDTKEKSRLVSLIHNSCCESKMRYILFNWPWQIIPTWRLYNKTNKALKELTEYVPKEN